MPSYTPNRGDLVWINFNPQSGHEQAGKRPALVLSPSRYNSKVGLAILCPVTNKIKVTHLRFPSHKIFQSVEWYCQIKSKVWTGKVEILSLYVS